MTAVETEIISLAAELSQYKGVQVLDFCIDRLSQVGIEFTDEHAQYIMDHFVDE